MWADYLDNNRFVKSLYDDMPELIGVKIEQFGINCDGNRAKLVFEMPRYATKPPQKWNDKKCNIVRVRLDFEQIKFLDFKVNKVNYMGNINIFLDKNNLLNLQINGGLDLFMIAEFGCVQKVEAIYVKNK